MSNVAIRAEDISKAYQLGQIGTGTISRDLERWYAARAGSHKVEVPGASHSVYISHPKEVAKLIEEAAQHAR